MGVPPPPRQFAYRKLHSTITSLISVSDYWYENIVKSDVNFALFFDLKKAVDTVDHEILIRKLRVYGIDGMELEWFRSYLSSRQQYCTLNGCKSSSQPVKCGIPRGSCLGSLLFILHLNEFESYLKFSTRQIFMQMIRKFHSRRSYIVNFYCNLFLFWYCI